MNPIETIVYYLDNYYFLCPFHNICIYLSLFLQLNEFVKPLDICCGSSILKIRELASLALVSILSKSGLTYEDYLRKWLFEDRMLSHNEGHGRILQVRTRTWWRPLAAALVLTLQTQVVTFFFLRCGRVRGEILALYTQFYLVLFLIKYALVLSIIDLRQTFSKILSRLE